MKLFAKKTQHDSKMSEASLYLLTSIFLNFNQLVQLLTLLLLRAIKLSFHINLHMFYCHTCEHRHLFAPQTIHVTVCTRSINLISWLNICQRLLRPSRRPSVLLLGAQTPASTLNLNFDSYPSLLIPSSSAQ